MKFILWIIFYPVQSRESFWFNRIRKSETPSKCVCVCWVLLGVKWTKNEIQFNYTRSAGSTCTESQCSPPIAVNKLPLFVFFSSFLHSLTSFVFFVPLLYLLLLFMNERTIVFSGQTSGSTDFSINSSRCAQPPALPNNHQYFSLTFCLFANGNDLCVAFVRSPSHSRFACFLVGVWCSLSLVLALFLNLSWIHRTCGLVQFIWTLCVLYRLFMLLSVALNYFSNSNSNNKSQKKCIFDINI